MRFAQAALAFILVLAVAQIAAAQTVAPDPLTSAFSQLGPWGVALAALILYAWPKLLPLFQKKVEAEAELATDHTKFIQDLVTAFRADLAAKDAAFIAAIEKLVGRVHGLEIEVARLAERLVPDPSRPTPTPTPTPEAAHAG